MRQKIKKLFKTKWELFILIIFFSWLFFDLLSSHTLLNINGVLFSSGSSWGDLPFHLTLINNFKDRGLITTLKEFPLYYGEKTRYPFVFDYLSALLLHCGLNLRWAIILPSFIALVGLVIFLYYMALKITKKRLVAFLTPFFFVFNGATISLYYFWQDFIKSKLSFFQFLNHLDVQYTHLSKYGIEFSNLIADFLLPQRTIVLGLIFSCAALFFLWNYWESKKSKYLLKAGTIIGLMPFIHTHLFLALIIFCFFLFIIQLIYYKEFKIKDWLKWGTIVFVLAIGPVLWLFPFHQKNFFRVQLGWMANGKFFWWFWLKNLGFYLIFLISGLALIKKFDHWQKIISFYLPAVFIWILGNVFIFQPWEFDNMKIFILWFLLSVIIMGLYFSYLVEKKSFICKIIALIFLLITILPGFLATCREITIKYGLYQPADVELSNYLRQNTRPNDLFLTTDKHNNPVSSLAGRQIVMGYTGWLWSHGIDYKNRYNDIIEIYKGSDKARQLISKYAPKYILVEKQPSSQWLINYDYFKNYFRAVFENPLYIVYKIEN